MPPTDLYFFKDSDGSIPLKSWLDQLDKKLLWKCIATIERLEQQGHALRRPTADYLDRGIYELRVKFRRANYRILYFFSGKNKVVLSHGLTKEKRIPVKEIDRAVRHWEMVNMDFLTHTISFNT